MTRVAVIGAGITGLAAAWLLDRAGADIVVLERSDRVGGKLLTGQVAGQPAELGADAFLARDPAAERLVRAVGLGDDLVAPATGQAWVWIDGRLCPIPAGTVLGAPTDLVTVLRSGVLGPAALLRAGLDLLLPARPVVGDRSVADVVGDRFGRAVVDRLVEPLLGGVYAGRPDQLSVEATSPQIAAAARSSRSLLTGLRRTGTGSSPAPTGPAFLTLAGGLDQLTEALADDLGERLHRGAAVTRLGREGGSWQVETDTSTHAVDHVVITTPAPVASGLLTDVAPAAAAELAMIPYASVCVVSLAYPRSAADQMPSGSGMLVPRTEGRLIKAVTFVSRKWPHRDRGGHVLVRASVGRIDDERWRDLTHDELARRVDAEIRWACGISEPAVDAVVTPWEQALPQYLVGHRDRVNRIRLGLPDGLHVAGAACDGVGISPCIASAETVTAAVLA